jgi:uncharacterized protein YkwD
MGHGKTLRKARRFAEKEGVDRLRASLVVLAIVGVLSGVSIATATAAPVRDGLPRHVQHSTATAVPGLNAGIVARINMVRAARGLPRLAVSVGLGAAARFHSRQMAESGQFRHESPDGSSFWQRVRRFYGAAGFRSWSVGEALVWQSPTATASEVVAAWLASPPHREILLDPSFREVGVSAVQDSAAPGDFDGLQATIVTADFGVRSR